MNFEHDVFVSYAHLDDAALVEGRRGWVSNLHRALEIRVGQFLGKSPHIWRDPKLTGDDRFADTLVELLTRVAVLVSVVTPRYVRSEWTTRELNEFCKAAEQQRVQTKHKTRVFKVLKTPVPLEQQSPVLQSLLGYEFFKVDPESGRVREFDEVFGPEAHRSFWTKLDDLAQDVCDLLGVVEQSALLQALAGDGARDAVFLAVTTLDLQDQREAIKRDLQQHGYIVLPDRELSRVGAEVEAAVREDLARCSMSIHFVGRNYSLTPEGAVSSLVEIQNELAIERGETGRFSRLVWIPPGLQVDDPRQRQIIDRLRLDPRMKQGADLLESPLEDLRIVIRDVVDSARAHKQPSAAPSGAAAPASSGLASIYLVYDQRDTAVVRPWADFLFEQAIEVIHSLFEGDEGEVREYHREALRTADDVVIFFGAASEVWLSRKLSELQKIAGYGRTKPAPLVTVCLLPPKTPDKERFRTHKASVVPQWDGLSPDSWQPIIARLRG